MGGQENNTGATGKKRRVWKLLLLMLGIAALLVAARYVYVMFVDPMSAFDKPKTTTTPQTATARPTVKPGETPEPTPEPTPTLSPEEQLRAQADLDFMKNKVNILMLGWDESPERDDEDSELYRDENNNFRSDVLMLATIDFEKKTVDLISVPRDTYAPIYNTKGRWKINAAFAKGGSADGDGFEYAMKTVSNLLGVPIDYYAGVNMVGLKAVVDAMGGVDYDVDVRISLNGRVLEKGYQHMDGQQVLDYVRARKGISTDVGRADRQQRMLFAIFDQLKSRNQLVKIPEIYASVQDKIMTNLNSEQIAALSVFAMSLDQENLNRHTLEGEYISNVYNASFYVLYNSKLKALVKDIFGIDIKPNPRYDVGYVRGDKSAAEALSYADGAEYLMSVFLQPEKIEELPGLKNDILAVKDVAERDIPVNASEEKVLTLTADPLDNDAIAAAEQKLINSMYALCMKYGITQAHVLKSELPKAFYDMLPIASPSPGAAAASSPLPAQTAMTDGETEGTD